MVYTGGRPEEEDDRGEVSELLLQPRQTRLLRADLVPAVRRPFSLYSPYLCVMSAVRS